MQRFIPQHQIYTIPPHQQIPQAIPGGAYQVNPNQYQSFPPTPQYQPQPSYAHAAPPPMQPINTYHARPAYHHAPQQSIGGIPYQLNGYQATSPVDNYSVYNGSVYHANGQPAAAGVATPGAPPPSVVTHPPQHQQRSTLTHYQQLMALRNTQTQGFKQQYETQTNGQQPQQQQVLHHHPQMNQLQQQPQPQTQQLQQLQHAVQPSQNTMVIHHAVNNNEPNAEQEDDDADGADNKEDNKDANDNDEYASNDDGNNINDLLEGDAILAGEYVGIIRYLGPLFLNPYNTSEITKEQYIGIECSAEGDTCGQGHDGWYKDFRYFKTKNGKNTGLLIASSKFTKKLSPFRLLQTIKKQRDATDELQEAITSLKKHNKLLSVNLEALLLQQHKMKQFFAKHGLLKNGNLDSKILDSNDERLSKLPMLSRKSNTNDNNSSNYISDNDNASIAKRKNAVEHLQDPNDTKEHGPITPLTPDPLDGIKTRSGHTANATMELSIHLNQPVMQVQPQQQTPTDRMLDELQNNGVDSHDVLDGSAKHLIARQDSASSNKIIAGNPHIQNQPYSHHNNNEYHEHGHNQHQHQQYPHSHPPEQMVSNGQYYYNAAPRGYGPQVIQEHQPQPNNNNNNNYYAHAEQHHYEQHDGYNNMQSPGIESNQEDPRYSQFLRQLVPAGQQQQQQVQQQQITQQQQQQQQQQQMMQQYAPNTGMNTENPNELTVQNPNGAAKYIPDMDEDGIIRGTPGGASHEQLTPIRDGNNTPLDSIDGEMNGRKSSKSSREHRGSYTEKGKKKKNKKKRDAKNKMKNRKNKKYGLHPTGVRMATDRQYPVDQYANYSDNNSPHERGYDQQRYSPSNSVHSSPINKKQRKYRNRKKNKRSATPSDEDSNHGYPNTYAQDAHPSNNRNHRAIINDNSENIDMKNKKHKNKRGLKQIKTAPPLSKTIGQDRSPRSYINIDTPTATSLSATISASKLVNIGKYKKPAPLLPLSPHNAKRDRNSNDNHLSTNNLNTPYTERLLLQDQDTLSSKLATTHKTVDLPSPSTTKHKKNKRKKKKKNHEYDDDDDDEDMEVFQSYDVYGSITQTEDESPEPHHKNTRIVHDEPPQDLNINQKKLQLLNTVSGESKDDLIVTPEDNDEFNEEAADHVMDLKKDSLPLSGLGISNKYQMGNNPRFSTLSIDSEFQNDHETNLTLEDDSIQDMHEFVSPRIKNSNIIEFYVDKTMSIEQVEVVFGLNRPIKIIPHELTANSELQGNRKKIEAIFKDNDTATRAVQMLKQQHLSAVFKKSPRQTLVSNSANTPILQPILSVGTHKPQLMNNDSVSTTGMDDGFGKIIYRPHRAGGNSYGPQGNGGDNNNHNGNGTPESDGSIEWTESPTDEDDNSEEDDSAVWALEQGFSGSGSSDDGNIDDDDL